MEVQFTFVEKLNVTYETRSKILFQVNGAFCLYHIDHI